MGHRSYDIYLSYSSRNSYLICPRLYKLRYIDKLPRDINPQQIFFGSVIGKVFQWFYDRRVWMASDVNAATLALIGPAVKEVSEDEKFDPTTNSRYYRELMADLHKYVSRGIDTIKKYKLLSPDSRTEVQLHTTYHHPHYDLTIRFGGYADFIHRSQGIWILDGKGSKYRDEYTDAEQVIWYAVLFYLKYQIAPDRIGFIHWRFPDDPIQWIMYNDDSIRSSLNTSFKVATQIKEEKFDPKPSRECYRCVGKKDCREGKQYLATQKVKSGGRIGESMWGIEIIS